jgi:hypothetical protein
MHILIDALNGQTAAILEMLRLFGCVAIPLCLIWFVEI